MPLGADQLGFDFKELMGNLMPRRSRARRTSVAQARELLIEEEAQRLIDSEAVRERAIARAEQSGIVFIDELDKIAGREARGPDVSPYLRWLPIVTFLQVGFDIPMAMAVPKGYGHNIDPSSYIDSWIEVTQPKEWSETLTKRLKERFEKERE